MTMLSFHCPSHAILPAPQLNLSRESSDLYQQIAAMAIGSGAVNSHAAKTTASSSKPDSVVAEALEVARSSPDGIADPKIKDILEGALDRLWERVMASPDSYVMTRDEFAVFNFFQHRFADDPIARDAKQRYWSNTAGP